jgi:hypothetical protein
MLAVTGEKLTERERTCVEHFRQAAERGGSFAEYCRTNGLGANEWHAVRHGMVLKGLVPPAKQSAVKRTKATKGKRSRFAPVQLAASARPISLATPLCRVRHPSGWAIEFASPPEADWPASLMRGEPA